MEPLLPQMVADHCNRTRSGRIRTLGRQEGTSQNGLDTKHVEIIGGHIFARDALRILIAHGEWIKERCGDTVDLRQSIAVIQVIAPGRRAELAGGHDGFDRHQPVASSGPRDGIYQKRVDPAENRGVCRNAQSQREHGSRGESRTVPEHADAIGQILEKDPHR